MSKRPPKIERVIEAVRAAVAERRLIISGHAEQRMSERRINDQEVVFILLNGFHEAKRDRFDDLHGDWSYTIRGRTIDRRNLRIAVAEESPGFLVVTAIDLDSGDIEW